MNFIFNLSHITHSIVSNSPGIVSHSPRLVSNSPRLVSNSPRILSSSPGIVSHSPGLVSNSPRLVPQNYPRIISRRMNVVIKSRLEIFSCSVPESGTNFAISVRVNFTVGFSITYSLFCLGPSPPIHNVVERREDASIFE